MNQFYLLSFPRSGNHWLRYIVEWNSERPTVYSGKDWVEKTDLSIYQIIDMPVDPKAEPIGIKRHWMFEDDDQSNKLVMCLRNPKEVIPRHTFEDGQYHPDRYESYLDIYLKNIDDFNNWKNDKFVYYYKDMIVSPEETIRSVLEFMGIPVKEDFIKDLNYHKQRCIDLYNIGEKSVTGGNKILHHSKILSIKELEWFDEKIRNGYNAMLGRYSGR